MTSNQKKLEKNWIRGKFIVRWFFVVIIILILLSFCCNYVHLEEPKKESATAEYGVPFLPLTNMNQSIWDMDQNKIQSSNMFVTSKGIFVINITYIFEDWEYVYDAYVAKKVATEFEIDLVNETNETKDYIMANKNNSVIVVKGISTQYQSYIGGFSEITPTPRDIIYGNQTIVVHSTSPITPNIEFPSCFAIFFNDTGWQTVILDMDLGIKSILVNEDEIQQTEQNYLNSKEKFEKDKTDNYQLIAVCIPLAMFAPVCSKFWDDYYELKYSFNPKTRSFAHGFTSEKQKLSKKVCIAKILLIAFILLSLYVAIFFISEILQSISQISTIIVITSILGLLWALFPT